MAVVDTAKLERFCHRIAAGMPSNAYHNAIHVIDVVQSTHGLIEAGDFPAEYAQSAPI
jgi:hypothetical protein